MRGVGHFLDSSRWVNSALALQLGPRRKSISAGLSLVELLVVIAIIAILIALLLPSVQAARESARRVQCTNQLKNVGIALLTYHDVNKAFPYGGWGHYWVGVPERNCGLRQPGGWIYSLLPYVEETSLHDLGEGASGAEAIAAYSQRVQTPIPLFNCPSRRSCAAWPISDTFAYAKTPRPYGSVTSVARTDYAINAGTAHVIGVGGPADLQQGDDAQYWATSAATPRFSGISHQRRATSLKSIIDGTSKTYLVGEKHVPVESYMDGTAAGDNASLYAGYCSDLHRFAGVLENLKVGASPFAEACSDATKVSSGPTASVRFGSAHSTGFNMLYCDGATQFVGFDVDPEVHLRAGHRKDDGKPIEQLN